MSPKGYKQTEEHIRKRAEANTGSKRTKAQKKKMSEANTGKKNPNYGKVASDETKKKQSEAQLGEKSNSWKDGRIVTSGGYIILYKPEHPNSVQRYISEHRLIAEKYLDRYLTKEEVIHHINNIKDDNRPENLYLFESQAKHKIFHNLKNKPILKSNLIN